MPVFDAMRTRGQRLRRARIDAGYKTMRDAVRALGVGYSTYAGHETDSRDYGPDEAILYARVFRKDAGWLLTGKESRSSSVNGVRGNNSSASPAAPLAMIPVSGIVRAGAWQDVNTGDGGLYKYVPAALDYPSEWQFAYTVEGTSLDKIAVAGDILICLDLIKSGINLADRDLVILERSRFAGQMVERTGKRLHQTVRGFELWPESNDPAHQEPIIMNGHESEAEEIRVTAKVIWIMKRP